ncbi:MAG: hypothetical protein LC126_28590 [Bryobacterales bacterium]|nr:hypothetical protein [Bryobacterales bacterium]
MFAIRVAAVGRRLSGTSRLHFLLLFTQSRKFRVWHAVSMLPFALRVSIAGFIDGRYLFSV